MSEIRRFETSRFGLLEVGEEAVIRFPLGIPAFEDHKEWAFVGDDQVPIKWLQSLSDGDVALPVCPPELVFPGYRAEVAQEDLEVIEASSEEELGIMVVLTIPGDVKKMTANLRAPLIFNHVKRLGCQVILKNEDYSIRHRVFGEGPEEEIVEPSPLREGS
ncbi:MAG: flagellar assembly protein FliW [Thermanaerothrix sp.]|nr:flagellar assembly protein FliW [Thermanaerothrix sp.]